MSDSNVKFEISTWMRENLIWVIGLMPVILASFRLLVVAQGDTEALRALLANVNVLVLVLSTILPTVPSLVFWLAVWSWDWHRLQTAEKRFEVPQWVFTCVSTIVAIVALNAMPLQLFLINIGILIAMLGYIWWRSKRDGRHAPKLRLNLTGMLALLVINSVGIPLGPSWLPTEEIEVKGQPSVVGYVVSSDPRWFVYLERRGSVVTVPASNVETRTNCSVYRSTLNHPLIDLLGTTRKFAPRCPDE